MFFAEFLYFALSPALGCVIGRQSDKSSRGMGCMQWIRKRNNFSGTTFHRDLDHYVFVSFFGIFLFVLVLLYSLGYVGSRDLASQWPAIHSQNKQRFLNETFKPRWFILLFHLAKVFDAEPKFRTLVLSFNNLLLGSLLFLLNNCSYSIVVFEALFIWLSFDA